jgi:hypothetical protein
LLIYLHSIEKDGVVMQILRGAAAFLLFSGLIISFFIPDRFFIHAPETQEDYFLKKSEAPVFFVDVMNPDDTAKLISIPLFEDSSFRKGKYLKIGSSTPDFLLRALSVINEKGLLTAQDSTLYLSKKALEIYKE